MGSETDVNAERDELKAKLGIMELLSCGANDVDWFTAFLTKFRVDMRQISMYGSTFNEIVSGIYNSSLKFSGISEKLHDVKMTVDMSNSCLEISGHKIDSLADLQAAANAIGASTHVPEGNGASPDEIADLVVKKLRPEIEEIILRSFKETIG